MHSRNTSFPRRKQSCCQQSSCNIRLPRPRKCRRSRRNQGCMGSCCRPCSCTTCNRLRRPSPGTGTHLRVRSTCCLWRHTHFHSKTRCMENRFHSNSCSKSRLWPHRHRRSTFLPRRTETPLHGDSCTSPSPKATKRASREPWWHSFGQGAKTAKAATTSHAALIPPAAATFAWAREANVARTLLAATLLAAREARVAGMHVQLQAASAADHWADRSASGILSPRPRSVRAGGSADIQ